MKLRVITGRYYLVVSMAVIAVMGLLLFFLLHWVFNQEIDEQLHNNAEMIFQSLEKSQVMTPGSNSNIILLEDSGRSFVNYRDTMLYTPADAELEPFRWLTVQREINGKTYRLQIWASRLEWNDFFEVIFGIFLLTAILLFGFQWLINRMVEGKLWRPFFMNLDKLKKYSVRQATLPDFTTSTIDEFESFRKVAARFSEQARDEYLAVKNFSENAAHEIQTPLAIIRNKLDQISQNKNLSNEDLQRAGEAMEATDRLSRLIRALLLLTKLENDQFDKEEAVDISRLLENQLEDMAERFAMKKITLTRNIAEKIRVKGNTTLVEVLFANLLQNILRHTTEKGVAQVKLTSDAIIFRNSGEPSFFPDPSTLFRRFHKGEASQGGTGLGLAIVKEICQVLGWKISYQFNEGFHIFSLYYNEL